MISDLPQCHLNIFGDNMVLWQKLKKGRCPYVCAWVFLLDVFFLVMGIGIYVHAPFRSGTVLVSGTNNTLCELPYTNHFFFHLINVIFFRSSRNLKNYFRSLLELCNLWVESGTNNVRIGIIIIINLSTEQAQIKPYYNK